MRAFCRARLVEREELPRPPAADLPVRGQRLALQRPRAVEENGDRVKVVLTVTLVQHDERRNVERCAKLGETDVAVISALLDKRSSKYPRSKIFQKLLVLQYTCAEVPL